MNLFYKKTFNIFFYFNILFFKIIENIEESQDKGIRGLEKTNTRIDKFLGNMSLSFCNLLFMVGIAVVAFFFTIIFIKIS